MPSGRITAEPPCFFILEFTHIEHILSVCKIISDELTFKQNNQTTIKYGHRRIYWLVGTSPAETPCTRARPTSPVWLALSQPFMWVHVHVCSFATVTPPLKEGRALPKKHAKVLWGPHLLEDKYSNEAGNKPDGRTSDEIGLLSVGHTAWYVKALEHFYLVV